MSLNCEYIHYCRGKARYQLCIATGCNLCTDRFVINLMRELLGQELLTDEKKQNLVNIGEIWIKNRSKLTRREIVNNELKIKYLKKLQKLKCWKYYLKTETSTFDLKNQIPLASVSA